MKEEKVYLCNLTWNNVFILKMFWWCFFVYEMNKGTFSYLVFKKTLMNDVNIFNIILTIFTTFWQIILNYFFH